MTILSYVRSIFALDTIDTRFTNSSTISYKAAVDGRADPTAADAKRGDSVPGPVVKPDLSRKPIAQPSQWNTPEFYFYYFVFIVTVPYMFWVTYDVSRRRFKQTHLLVDHLTSGQRQTRIIINTSTYFHLAGYRGARSLV